MAKFSLTKKAVQDLKKIWFYTLDTWSEKQADRYVNQILKHCNKIADQPNKGKQYEMLTPDLRGSKVNKHILFYRIVQSNEIEIVRILHERMDIKRRLEK